MRKESLKFLKNLIEAPSPSGYEEPAAEVVREYTKFADLQHTDRHGNTWAALNPKADMKIMLAGHMDEIGFQVRYIDDKGLVFFAGIGGHDTMIPLGQSVYIHGRERVTGVIGKKPIHLLTDAERGKRPEMHNMWIDIGASTKEEAEKVIRVGDPITYRTGFIELMGDRAAARGFDNRVGTWSVMEALRLLKDDGGLDPKVGVYAVATVQEEIGLRGARTAAHAINPQSGLAIDVDFAIDHPGLSKSQYGETNIGDGPSVTRGANINPIVFDLIEQGAKAEEIPYQVAAEPGGTGTDANAMQVTRDGMATGLVGIPLRYMHTPVEVLSLTDTANAARIMAAYCRQVKPDTDFTPRRKK
ncbi:MAG: M42 family metallopeptidase [Fimbriimonadaceae bacterium]|nr:M42 family metallopeptidase [Fimbriimonadaceae bacterium]